MIFGAVVVSAVAAESLAAESLGATKNASLEMLPHVPVADELNIGPQAFAVVVRSANSLRCGPSKTGPQLIPLDTWIVDMSNAM